MSDHTVQLLMLIVQGLALLGLTVYCIETYRMRTAAQRQVRASQDSLRISMDQLEGFAKPCITFWSELRDGAEAILDMHGARGNLVARPDGGSFVIHNLGNGLAINLKYYITRNNPAFDQLDARRYKYIPTVPASARLTLVETLGGYNTQHEATFEYESIGGRKYRSAITLNHHVITAYHFEEIKP